jgi:hypothetical protein
MRVKYTQFYTENQGTSLEAVDLSASQHNLQIYNKLHLERPAGFKSPDNDFLLIWPRWQQRIALKVISLDP